MSEKYWCCKADFGKHEETCENHPLNKQIMELKIANKNANILLGEQADLTNTYAEKCKELEEAGNNLLKIIDEECREKHSVHLEEMDVNGDWNLNITLTWDEIQAFRKTLKGD